jgi:hypothetical protein
VRVPLIVKPAAGTVEPGKVIAADVSGFDVMPTLLELAGIPPAGKLDARSLVPLLRGKEKDLGRPVVTETSLRGLALVHGGYKYVLQPGGEQEALFHLASDTQELRDLASERPEELARLRELAIAYLLEHRPGRFLVVRAEAPARFSVSTRSVRKLAGPPVRLEPSSTGAECSLELAQGGVLLLEVEAPEGEAVTVQGLEPRGATPAFEPWNGRRLASLTGTGVWPVRGPEPRKKLDTSSDPVDAELLEELRRLGYAE